MHTCIHAYIHTCIHAYRGCRTDLWLPGVSHGHVAYWVSPRPGVSNGPVAPRGCRNQLQQTGGTKSPLSPSRVLYNYAIVHLYKCIIGILVYWYIGWYIGILEYWRHNHPPDFGRRIIILEYWRQYHTPDLGRRIRMYVCMHACMHVCMYVCMYVGM